MGPPEGRVDFTWDWKSVTYRELLAAHEAGLLEGDPYRPYLLLQPGIGSGALVDWQTLAAIWEACRYLLDTLAAAGGAYGAKKLLWDKLRGRAADAPEAVRRHQESWTAKGARPDNSPAISSS